MTAAVKTLEAQSGVYTAPGSPVAHMTSPWYYKRDEYMSVHKLVNAKVITTALTGGSIYTSAVYNSLQPVLSVLLQGKIDYGADGTSIDAYVQTSIDGGATFGDVANFHFTTQDDNFVFNLSALTPVTTQFTPDDAAISNNTCKDGYIGQLWRVKVKSSGTYSGNTNISVIASFRTAIVG